MAPDRPTSLVTGASSGIGAAFARALGAGGHDLILTARRTDRLDALAAELVARHGIAATVLPCDLGEAGAVARLTAAIEGRGLRVDWLINNAGYGVPGTFAASDWHTHATFLRVLLEVPTELAHRLLPGMQARGHGRIVNVASLAGFLPGSEGHTLYGAVKAYLIVASQSLALEYRGTGVHVCALCPGFTRTEFQDVTGMRAVVDRLPGWMWQGAEAVVAEGIEAVERGEAVRVTGRVNRAIKTAVALMPDRLALWLSARQSHRFRDTRTVGQGIASAVNGGT